MRLLVFIATITLCLAVSLAVLQRFEQAPKPDGSLSFLVIGDWGRRGAYNQSEVAVQVIVYLCVNQYICGFGALIDMVLIINLYIVKVNLKKS